MDMWERPSGIGRLQQSVQANRGKDTLEARVGTLLANESLESYKLESSSPGTARYRFKDTVTSGSTTFDVFVDVGVNPSTTPKVIVRDHFKPFDPKETVVNALAAHKTLHAIQLRLRSQNEAVRAGYEAEIEAFQNGSVAIGQYHFLKSESRPNSGRELSIERRFQVNVLSASGEKEPFEAKAVVRLRRMHDGSGGRPYSLQMSVQDANSERFIIGSPDHSIGGTPISNAIGRALEANVDARHAA